MRFKEYLISEDYSFSTLEEPPKNLPIFPFREYKALGSFDNYHIWVSLELPKPFKIFAIRSDDLKDVLTYCIVNGDDFNGFNKFIELWVNPKYRGQGIGTIMILFLLKKLELKLLISKDGLVSDSMRQFLKSSLKSKKIKIKDTNLDLIPDENVLKIISNRTKNDFELVLTESKSEYAMFADNAYSTETGKRQFVEPLSCNGQNLF